MARNSLRNNELDTSFREWLEQMSLIHPEIGQDDKLQCFMGLAFQNGADMQRHEVEKALRFSETKQSRG